MVARPELWAASARGVFDQDARGLPALVEALAPAADAEAALQEQIQRGQVAVRRAELEAKRTLGAGQGLERQHQAVSDAAAALPLADGDRLHHVHVPAASAEGDEADADLTLQREQRAEVPGHVQRVLHRTRCELQEGLAGNARDELVVLGLVGANADVSSDQHTHSVAVIPGHAARARAWRTARPIGRASTGGKCGPERREFRISRGSLRAPWPHGAP